LFTLQGTVKSFIQPEVVNVLFPPSAPTSTEFVVQPMQWFELSCPLELLPLHHRWSPGETPAALKVASMPPSSRFAQSEATCVKPGPGPVIGRVVGTL